MTKYDRKEHLKQIHQKRKSITSHKVNEAIQRLVRANKNINFNSVADEAGVSKATLYNNSDLRKRIEFLRKKQSNSLNPKQIKCKMSNSNKDAIIESLKRKIKKLEEDNKDLRKQLKVAYGDIYKKF